MNKYIGTKLIEAEEMTYGNFFEKHPERWSGNITNEIFDKIMQQEGYLVKYSDGYESWSPKEVFEKSYLKVDNEPRLSNGISVSSQMVDKFIKETYISTIGNKTTMVRAILVNDFEIIETSTCIDLARYDESMGAKICMEKIRDIIWQFLGFLVQTAWKGVNGNGEDL